MSKRSIYGPKESNRYDKELFDIHNCLYRLLLTDSLNFNYWYVVLIKREKSNTCVKIGLQMKQKGGGDYHIFVIYIQVSLCCFIYSTYCFVVFLVNSNNGLTYGSILSGRWNTLFGSFILVYCKACSSWTKIGTRHIFFEKLQSKVVPVCKKIRLIFFFFAQNCSKQVLSVGLETGEYGCIEA